MVHRLCLVRILVFSFVLLGFMPACQQQTAPDTRAADERAIRETDVTWSKVAGAKDLEAILSFYTDDASLLPANAPMATGKDAMRTAWSQLLATPGFGLSWQPTKAEVSRGGDLGYTIGTYELTMTGPGGQPIIDRGKYVVVWKKQADGNWKAAADIFNSSQPPPTAAKP
jgi:uncharacterized protein (TIGR02246 family)